MKSSILTKSSLTLFCLTLLVVLSNCYAQNPFLLDSVVIIDKYHNPDRPIHKKTFNYDSWGNNVKTLGFDWNRGLEKWDLDCLVEREFDDLGNLCSMIECKNYGSTMRYAESSIQVEYNSKSLPKTIRIFRRNTTENKPWGEIYQYHEREYDEEGRIIHEFISDCDTAQYYPIWYYDIIWAYDQTDSTFSISEKTVMWDYEWEDTISNYKKMCFCQRNNQPWMKLEYTSNSNTRYKIERWQDSDGNFLNESVHIYHSPTGWNLTSQVEVEIGAPCIDAFFDENRNFGDRFLYWGNKRQYPIGNLSSYCEYHYVGINRKWEYELDNQGKIVSKTIFEGDDHNSWNETEKHEYEYRNQNIKKHSVYYWSWKDEWELKVTYEYDEHLNLISEFDGYYKTSYYYSANSTKIGSYSINLEELLIYPNPTPGILNINGLSESDRVDVYSINGQLKKSITNFKNPVNLENLPSGMYIIVFSVRGQQMHKSFIKY